MYQDIKNKQKSPSIKSNKFKAITPRYLKFAQKSLKVEESKSLDPERKQSRLEIINHNQLRRLEYLLKITEQQERKKKISDINNNITLKMQSDAKQQIQEQDMVYKQGRLQKQYIKEDQYNSKNNILNMQLVLTTYKTKFNKLQNLKKKFSLYQKQKLQNKRQNRLIKNQDTLQKIFKQNAEQLNNINNNNIKLPRIQSSLQENQKKYIAKLKYQQNKNDQKNKNKSHKTELVPIQTTQKVNFQIKNQCLSIQKLRLKGKRQKYSNRKKLAIQLQKISQSKSIAEIQTVPALKSPQKSQKSVLQDFPQKQKLLNLLRPLQKQQSKLLSLLRPKSQQKKQAIKQFSLTKQNFNKKDYFIFGLGTKPTTQNKIFLYRDFLWKINMSNSIFIEPDIQLEKNYKVYIGNGNNSMLIKGLIKRRFWWTIVDKITQDTNFIWTQLKNNDFFKLQKVHPKQARKYQNSSFFLSTGQTTANTLQSQMIKVQSKISKKKDLHQNIFSQVDFHLWNQYYQKNKKIQQQMSNQMYNKRAILLKIKNAIKIKDNMNLKVHNHFQSNFFIGNKKALFYSMRKYYTLNNLNVFDYLPVTFHISRGENDPQYKQFLKYYNQFQLKNNKSKNIWIVKPGQFTNRGTGITVCSGIDDIKLRLRNRQKNSNGKLRTFIIQKYLERPFLYYKRKFDLRHYMMMTCINGNFKGYWYQQGYIRTTSYEYNIKNCKDNSIHLTNDAIQKYTEEYGKYQKGNKISYQQFQKYLDINYKGQNLNFFQTIIPKMKKISAQSMRACYFLLDPDKKMHNFQIFGMDFMIDQDFNPWLIQINTNPCLQLSSPLLSKIIPSMVQNAFKITLDPLFQPPYNFNKKYQLGENPLETNNFQIIFDQVFEGQKIQQLYKNIQKIDKNMGDIQQEDEQYEDEGKQWNQEI